MPRKTVAATAALATAAATLLVAPAADAAGRGATHVKATKHSVVAPSTLRPGVVHLHNDGSRAILVVRKKHEGTGQLATYLNSDTVRLAKRVYTRFGMVSILNAHEDDYVKLARGTYYLVGATTKVKPAGVRTVVVRGKGSNAARPSARNLTLSRAGALGGATTGPARTALRVRNHAGTPRAIASFPVPASATDEQLADLVAHPSFEKLLDLLGDDFGGLRLVAVVGPKQDVTVTPSLRAGRYLLWAVPMVNSASTIRAGQLAGLTLA